MEVNCLLQENRALGFVSIEDRAKSMPSHILARVLELRSAKAAGKPAPVASRGYIAEAERRNLTLSRSIAHKPTPGRLSHREIFREIPKGTSAEAWLEGRELRELRARAMNQGRVIQATTPKPLSQDEQRKIAEAVHEIFPVNF